MRCIGRLYIEKAVSSGANSVKRSRALRYWQKSKNKAVNRYVQVREHTILGEMLGEMLVGDINRASCWKADRDLGDHPRFLKRNFSPKQSVIAVIFPSPFGAPGLLFSNE